jgi:hypothetical protein
MNQGGFDPGLHYHDDRTFFYKTGLKAIVSRTLTATTTTQILPKKYSEETT